MRLQVGCSFNSEWKAGPIAFAVWMQTIRRLPGHAVPPPLRLLVLLLWLWCTRGRPSLHRSHKQVCPPFCAPPVPAGVLAGRGRAPSAGRAAGRGRGQRAGWRPACGDWQAGAGRAPAGGVSPTTAGSLVAALCSHRCDRRLDLDTAFPLFSSCCFNAGLIEHSCRVRQAGMWAGAGHAGAQWPFDHARCALGWSAGVPPLRRWRWWAVWWWWSW